MQHNELFNKLKTNVKRAACMLLSVTLFLSQISSVYAKAAPASYKKDEAIYVNLNADGSVDGCYVVNIFELNEKGEIKDYGNYSELKNMTGEENIEYKDQRVSINTDSDTLYYEGTLEGNILPWEFEIHYYLNGRELKADRLGGGQGNLRITLDIRENTDARDGFFDNFALQMELSLDTRYASDISAEGATIADVGRTKQLTWIVLPGYERQYEITAKVKDFRMDGFSINGIKMNLGITEDLFDVDSLVTSKLDELIDGVRRLDDGAQELVDAVTELNDGTDKLSGGAFELYDGAVALRDGADILAEGVDSLADGADALSGGALSLMEGAEALKEGAEDAEDGSEELYEGASDLKWGISDLCNGIYQLYTAGDQIGVLSDIAYQKALDEYGSSLSLAGYEVDENTSGDDIYAMMEQRASDLSSGTSLTDAKIMAIEYLLEEELAKESPDATVVQFLQVAVCALKFQAAEGDIAEEYVIACEYEQLLLDIGGINMLEVTYQELLANSVCQEVYSFLEAIVTEYITQLVKEDSVYAALATLYFCKVFNIYTDNIYKLMDGASQLYEGSRDLYNGSRKLYNGLGDLNDGLDTFYEGAETFRDGTETFVSGAGILKDGVTEFADGVDTFKDGAKELYDGTVDVHEGTVKLLDGCLELKDGTEELRVGVNKMTDQMAATIIDSINEMFGADFVIPSYTDERNDGSIDLVEFIFQSEHISMPQVTVLQEEAPKLSLWQKFIALFK